MGRRSAADRVKAFHAQISSATKLRDEWSYEYRVRELEDYYLGHQRRHGGQDDIDAHGNEKLIINVCYPTLETKLPSLYYNRPVAIIEPKPTRGDDVLGHARERAKLREDTVNTFIGDKRTRFMSQTFSALKESFYAYGIIEVLYSADFIDNPNAGMPLQLADGTSVEQPAKMPNPKVDPAEIESLTLKHIPSNQFLVSVSGKHETTWNEWAGYFEWVPLEDVINNPNFKNTRGLKTSASIKGKYKGLEDANPDPGPDSDASKARCGMVKLWRIWCFRDHCKYVFIEGHGEKTDEGDDNREGKFLSEEPFEFFPLAALRHHEIMQSWYPMPPMFNWRHPQNEKNDVREMRRIHRQRFKRKYLVNSQIKDEEMEKFESGEDGASIKVNDPERDIVPLADAPLDSGVWRDDAVSDNDFREITSVGGDQRGVPASETATQAQIISANDALRDNFSRQRVADWLCDIIEIMLRTIQSKMALPMWIMRNVDPLGAGAQQEAEIVAAVWQQITVEDLGDLNFDVVINVDTLSPVTEDTKRDQWMQVLSLIANPAIAMLLVSSPLIARKTLGSFGIKSDREIQEIVTALQTLMLQQAAAAASAGAGTPAKGGGDSKQPSGTGDGSAGGPQGASAGAIPGAGDIAQGMMAQMSGGVN